MTVEHSNVVYGALAVVTLVVAYVGNSWRQLAAIPTVGGPDYPLLSYKGSYRFVTDGKALLQEGYERYKGRVFKVARLDRWMIVLSGDALVDELRKLPDEVMSFHEAAVKIVEMKYTMGQELVDDPWHIELVRNHLTKRLDSVFPVVRDEVVAAFDEYVGSADGDWIALPAMNLIRKVVCRASNRVFVGLPKCRDPDWLNLNIEFTADVVKGRNIINLFPPFLKPLAGQWLTTVPAKLKRALRHLEPMINERRQRMEEIAENYLDKPDDMLMWILEDQRGSQSTAKEVTLRVLALNFAAVHTSSNACVNALYTLAANPQYMVPLREEVETVIRKHGWSKAAMTDMLKLDSFLKETMRVYSFVPFSVMRLAMKPHTFIDGTTVPAGALVCAPQLPTHSDSDNYDRADEFLPFRFASNDITAKRQFAATSLDYLAFGHGKHACPGRFFAGNEIKMMLCHIILNYDIRTEVEGIRPANRFIGPQQLPHPTAKILFRKRKDQLR